jgi:hypothetical protein
VRTGQRGWPSFVSLGAAYLLMLQMLVAGLCLGGAGEADQANPVICSSSGDQATESMPGHGHRHGPAFCLTGCNLCGSAAATPPEFRQVSAIALTGAAVTFAVPNDRIIAKSEPTSPRARGPPRAV